MCGDHKSSPNPVFMNLKKKTDNLSKFVVAVSMQKKIYIYFFLLLYSFSKTTCLISDSTKVGTFFINTHVGKGFAVGFREVWKVSHYVIRSIQSLSQLARRNQRLPFLSKRGQRVCCNLHCRDFSYNKIYMNEYKVCWFSRDSF